MRRRRKKLSLKSKINCFLWFGGASADRGENFAVKFLKRKGYKIICQNYDAHFAEIDIIAKKRDTTVFVEVKQRKSTAFGLPCEAVGKEKQGKIRRCAQYYIGKFRPQGDFRFDVVEIYGSCDGIKKPKAIQIENAF
ncbi:MAG: YraN family protein [Clostridia bacterium]|nr:YraN family protein [Clostridia bacterium]